MKRTLIAILTMGLVLQCGLAYAGDIAVIVNRKNTTDDISFKHLVKIFRQEKQYWKDGKKIYLILQERGTAEKAVMLKKIYRMTDRELKKFWLTKMFRGKISSFPKTLGSNEAVRRFVNQVPNAIGFIDSSFADESVKVLRIDGKFPQDDKDYILTGGIDDES